MIAVRNVFLLLMFFPFFAPIFVDGCALPVSRNAHATGTSNAIKKLL
jgi:hypothetical protein